MNAIEQADILETVGGKRIICPKCGAKYGGSSKLNCPICDWHLTQLKGLSGRDRTREMVRIRDKHTCQKCGSKWTPGNRRFDVHHLADGCGAKSKGYDKPTDMPNLITLCHRDHLNLDSVLRKMREKSSPRPNKPIKVIPPSSTSPPLHDIAELAYT